MKAYKVRLELNQAQTQWCRRCAGAARLVYNWGLAECVRQYEAHRADPTLPKPSPYSLCTQFNAIKREQYPWITELPYPIVGDTFYCLNQAYQNYFRQRQDGTVARRIQQLKHLGKWETHCARRRRQQLPTDPGYPQYRRRNGRQSFQLRSVKVETDRVYLPRLGWVRIRPAGYIPVGAQYGVKATISLHGKHWYIAILVTNDTPPTVQLHDTILGIDFGIHQLAVVSNGRVFENPRALRKRLCQLKRLQREYRHRTRGSQRQAETLVKIRVLHARIQDIRRWHLHQISDYVTAKCKPKIIVIEDLNVSGMLKNHCLAQAIADVGFYELRRQIEYKAARLGIQVIIADRWEPSSKTCSRCGHVKPVLTLDEREYHCEICGLQIDRDLNAARNLAAYGQRSLTD